MGVGRGRRRQCGFFSMFQCSSSLIKSSFCPPYPSALESYSFISRIFPLDTCQNKEYGLCISFILLYIRSLSHLNVEPHQRADLSSTPSSALHLGGKSRSTGLLWLLLHPRLCPAPAVPHVPWAPCHGTGAAATWETTVPAGNPFWVAKFLYSLLLLNFWCAFVA